MSGKVVALCGGIGGAKLALGLSRVLDPAELTIIVNSGDDFEHLGLHISPDVDTVLYTPAGLADPVHWGLAGESWAFMEALSCLGGEEYVALATEAAKAVPLWSRQVLIADKSGCVPSQCELRAARDRGIVVCIQLMAVGRTVWPRAKRRSRPAFQRRILVVRRQGRGGMSSSSLWS